MVNGVKYTIDDDDEGVWDCFKRVEPEEKPNLARLNFKRQPLWLNFFEGHSLAVYRPVKMARFQCTNSVAKARAEGLEEPPTQKTQPSLSQAMMM